MSPVVFGVQFENGAVFELMEFLDAVEERTASQTAFVPVEWVGGIGAPKCGRLLDLDDGEFSVEITDGEWDLEGDEE